MRKIFYTIATLCWVLLLVGCGNKEPVTCANDEVAKLVERYYAGDFSVCTESAFETLYNRMDESTRELVLKFGSRCEAISVIGDETEGFSVNIKYPSLESLWEITIADADGFGTDYKSIVLNGGDDNAKLKLAKSYLTALLSGDGFSWESMQVVVHVNGSDGVYTLQNDFELCKCVRSIADYEFNWNDVTTIEESNSESTAENTTNFKNVDSTGAFMFESGGARCLVYDIHIVSGQDAVAAVQEISSVNSNIVDGDGVEYYLKYSVKNLSQTNVTVRDCFKLATVDDYLITLDVHVSGLKSVAKLMPGESVELSSFLAGPEDSRLFWYDGEVQGSYILNIAL